MSSGLLERFFVLALWIIILYFKVHCLDMSANCKYEKAFYHEQVSFIVVVCIFCLSTLPNPPSYSDQNNYAVLTLMSAVMMSLSVLGGFRVRWTPPPPLHHNIYCNLHRNCFNHSFRHLPGGQCIFENVIPGLYIPGIPACEPICSTCYHQHHVVPSGNFPRDHKIVDVSIMVYLMDSN